MEEKMADKLIFLYDRMSGRADWLLDCGGVWCSGKGESNYIWMSRVSEEDGNMHALHHVRASCVRLQKLGDHGV